MTGTFGGGNCITRHVNACLKGYSFCSAWSSCWTTHISFLLMAYAGQVMDVFWVFASSNILGLFWHFRGTCFLYLQCDWILLKWIVNNQPTNQIAKGRGFQCSLVHSAISVYKTHHWPMTWILYYKCCAYANNFPILVEGLDVVLLSTSVLIDTVFLRRKIFCWMDVLGFEPTVDWLRRLRTIITWMGMLPWLGYMGMQAMFHSLIITWNLHYVYDNHRKLQSG